MLVKTSVSSQTHLPSEQGQGMGPGLFPGEEGVCFRRAA